MDALGSFVGCLVEVYTKEKIRSRSVEEDAIVGGRVLRGEVIVL